VTSLLAREPVASVLHDLHALAAVEDASARERIREREAQLGARLTNAERYAVYGAARLDDLVELRTGDALETLADLSGPVDLVFLDGRNDLYLDVLRLLEPVLAPDALVLADLSAGDPDLGPYLDHVRDADGAYRSLTLPPEPGLEVSVQRGPEAHARAQSTPPMKRVRGETRR
jgi:hypothetical protein